MSTKKESINLAYESGLFSQAEIAKKIDKSQAFVSRAIAETRKDKKIEQLERQLEEKNRELDFVKKDRDNYYEKINLYKFAMNVKNPIKNYSNDIDTIEYEEEK